MLTEEQIAENKITFFFFLSENDVPGADTQGLVEYLDHIGFFTSPASTKYHCNWRGGLCLHSLNVYHNLEKLVNMYAPGKYSKNTLLITGLLHDISKTGFYDEYSRNVKDSEGKWTQVMEYRVKDAHDRFLAGTHEENSMLLTGQFIPLSQEELIAIMNHHLHTNDGNTFMDQSAILNKYPLVTLLHTADLLSTFIDERDTNE